MPLLPVLRPVAARRAPRDALPQPSTSRKPARPVRYLAPSNLILLALSVLFVLVGVLDLAGVPTLRMTLCHAFPLRASTALTPMDADAAGGDASARALAERGGSRWATLSTLVLVAGHAIFTGDALDRAHFADEANWILEPFQHGQVPTFLRHIERGVRLAANDSSALLLFSGGQTRDHAGPRSEGLSYWLAAAAAGWYGHGDAVRNRTLSEDYARDSFENLMFSVCRFRQIVGRYPRAITVVGFEFKRPRFVETHRQAIRFPIERFTYVGIDPPGTDTKKLLAAEREHAMGPFLSDPYGCNSPALSGKRHARNPYIRFHPYPQGCPEMAPLFRYCGKSIYGGALPWAKTVPDKVKQQK